MARSGASRSILSAAVIVALVVAGCGGDDGEGPRREGTPSGYFVGDEELTEAEVIYGQAPEPHEDVTYQPDVVLLEDGAEFVRSVTADGMTWTIDAAAPRAEDLESGKVMFATSRGVGRIVDAHPVGDAIEVTIAPVELTEVIRDGTFTGDEPIALDDPIAYSSAGAGWHDEAAYAEDAPLDAVTGVGGGRGMAVGAPPRRVEQPRPVVGTPDPTTTGGLTAYPFCCENGVGAHVGYDDSGIRVSATAALVMKRPSARFHLVISGGAIRVAELEVSGAAGVNLDVAAASAIGTDRQLNQTFPIPIDFSVPVGAILGIPFTLTASQEIGIKTAFSAKNGNIKANGSYLVGGAMAFGYRDGTWGTRMPSRPTTRSSLLESIRGVSVGVNGIVLSSTTTFTLGIGAFGFTTGLSVGLTVSTGLTVGASLDRFAPLWDVKGTSLDCHGASLNVDAFYYVGYTLPGFVVKVINFLMKPFGVKPVPRRGGFPNPPGREHVYDTAQYEPAGCRPG